MGLLSHIMVPYAVVLLLGLALVAFILWLTLVLPRAPTA
jgi:hypothetical protein